jgi:hypothetical protein
MAARDQATKVPNYPGLGSLVAPPCPMLSHNITSFMLRQKSDVTPLRPANNGSTGSVEEMLTRGRCCGALVYGQLAATRAERW